MRPRVLSLHCCALLYVIQLSLVGFAACKTAYVSNSTDSEGDSSFLAALLDPNVSDIIVKTDYSIGSTFNPYLPANGQHSPVAITRNITVTGADGINTIFDLNYVRSAIELCRTCILRFSNVTVENDRRGPGGAVDFVLGQPGARLLFESAIRLRAACTSAAQSGEVAAHTERSRYWPNPTGKQQWKIVNVTFRGVEYTDQLMLVDHTVDDPRRIQEGRGPMGGVAVRTYNTTRICRNTVDPACLLERSSETCVNLLIDQVMALEAGTTTNRNVTAVAVGVAVAGAAVLGILLLVLLWARRRRHRLAGQGKALYQRGLVDKKGPEARDAQMLSDLEQGQAIRQPDAPFGGSKGWRLRSMLTAPLIQATEDANHVELRQLLGVGSFGRVYHGIWEGKEVAVKVVDHDSGETEAVENEVALMLAFNHPNIVRAFVCLSFENSSATGSNPLFRQGSSNVAAAVGGHSSSSSSSAVFRADSVNSMPHKHKAADSPQHRRVDEVLQATKQLPPHEVEDGGEQLRSAAQHMASCTYATAAPAGASACAAADSPSAFAAYSKLTASSHTPNPDITAYTIADAPTAVAAAPEGMMSDGGLASLDSAYQHTADTLATTSMQIRGAKRAEIWIVQEYCNLGTLSGLVSSWQPADASDTCMLQRLLLLKDAAQGLQVLHNGHVVHGDLNARNVLVSSDSASPSGMVAKLADLGLARMIKQHRTHRTTNTVGTMSHMPPELLRYGRMSPAVDVYAFGIMMWEVYTGGAAFKKLHYGQFFETVVLRNLRPLVPAGMAADYQLLMEHCWATEPVHRPTADRIIECLRYMITERQKNIARAEAACTQAAAAATAARGSISVVPAFANKFKRHSIENTIPELLTKPAPERHWFRLFLAPSHNAATAVAAQDTHAAADVGPPQNTFRRGSTEQQIPPQNDRLTEYRIQTHNRVSQSFDYGYVSRQCEGDDGLGVAHDELSTLSTEGVGTTAQNELPPAERQSSAGIVPVNWFV